MYVGRIVFVALFALIVAGCGASATATQPPPAATATPAPTSTPDATPTPAGPTRVSLEATSERTFSPDDLGRFKPGETVEFEIKNNSTRFHTFTVATGTDKQTILADIELQADETKTVTLTLPENAGDLYVFCRPHEARGMTGTIHVES